MDKDRLMYYYMPATVFVGLGDPDCVPMWKIWQSIRHSRINSSRIRTPSKQTMEEGGLSGGVGGSVSRPL